MILAIDQGSSKTQALIGDEQGNILGVGLAEGACHFIVGLDRAVNAVKQSAQAALNDAGKRLDDIDCVSAGMAGANWPDEFNMLTKELETLFPRAGVTVYNDCVPALYAGTQQKDAIILCAGTSLNAAVLMDRKLVWIYNNYIESTDEGGKGLATKALEAVLRAETGMGPKTTLRDRALSFFCFDSMQTMLLEFSRNCIQTPVKDFAVIVDEEAMRGDAVALNTQYEFGLSVSRYACAALKQYNMIHRPVDIVLSGGIFKARSSVMVDAIRVETHRIAPLAQIVEAVYEPVVGAYELALESSLQSSWWSSIERTAAQKSLVRF